MDKSYYKTLKSQIMYCLETQQDTRNSDITLMIAVWQTFYGIDRVVHVSTLYDLPREDNIKRIRAKLQNEEKIFLPTKLEVALKRGINEVDWRRALGYHTTSAGQMEMFV